MKRADKTLVYWRKSYKTERKGWSENEEYGLRTTNI